jgi:hypothetical protein
MLRAMRSTLFVALLAAAACGPMAQEKHTQVVGTGSGSGSDDPDTQMVCHNVADTGTLVSHQECHSVQRDKDDHDDTVRELGKQNNMPHNVSK